MTKAPIKNTNSQSVPLKTNSIGLEWDPGIFHFNKFLGYGCHQDSLGNVELKEVFSHCDSRTTFKESERLKETVKVVLCPAK